ncbi:hypothetical protein PR048_033727 [Dryococelus australis]|uniref:Uncharacterized protein n=1 Tax=Dryococelus australis TaxID=614101 RepID=A0ABQ9G4C2_9NEOP|nr:hypothetical protein PR048_033727 [Dryococelus australis]
MSPRLHDIGEILREGRLFWPRRQPGKTFQTQEDDDVYKPAFVIMQGGEHQSRRYNIRRTVGINKAEGYSVSRSVEINIVERRNERMGKREIPKKTRRPAASYGTIPTCDNPAATQSGIEPGSPTWELSCQTTT